MKKININDFTEEKECFYKGEKYCVRDNGAVLRYPKNTDKPRPLDNTWTFGKIGNHGYLYIASKGIHRIVATAYHGENLSKDYVVDHIDTNKQNNRPENLRWLTKEENILKNPNTIDKLQYITGCPIEELKENNWEKLHKYTSDKQDTSWMRPTTKEEAENFHKRQKQWSNKKLEFNEENKRLNDQLLKICELQETGRKQTNKMGDWVFEPVQQDELEEQTQIHYNDEQFKQFFKESLTQNAYQNWGAPTAFPCCPTEPNKCTLDDYLSNLEKGKILCQSDYFTSEITEFEYNKKEQSIIVQTVHTNENSIKPWHITVIINIDGHFCHYIYCSCFHEDGADKYYTIACGKEWAGGEVFDDLC